MPERVNVYTAIIITEKIKGYIKYRRSFIADDKIKNSIIRPYRSKISESSFKLPLNTITKVVYETSKTKDKKTLLKRLFLSLFISKTIKKKGMSIPIIILGTAINLPYNGIKKTIMA